MDFFTHLSVKEIGACFAVLFAVIDILGSIPIFADIRKNVGPIKSTQATMAAGLIMIAFMYFGTQLLGLFGVDVESFAVAGAFVIFIIAIEMILGVKIQKGTTSQSASIVPIAFPLIAGAGSLTTILTLRAEYSDVNIIIAVLLNMTIIFFVLKYVYRLERLLGEGVMSILSKVFGIILLAIAVKIFVSNIGALFMESF